MEEFFAADDPTAITCIYAHGARVTEQRAIARLPRIYDALVCDLPPDVRVRMVLFSWPNPKSVRVLQDFRVAEKFATPHGKYLAWLMENLDPADRVSLLSFSLGAQVLTSALNDLSNRQCPREQRRIRVVMWTAAEANTWILPGGRHGHALASVDRLLVIKNSCDPLLKRYYLMSPERHPKALGFCGVPCLDRLSEMALRIRQIDAGASLGFTHAYRRHIDAPKVVGMTRPYLFWQDVDDVCPTDEPLELISYVWDPSGATGVSPVP
jgi:hypothetical protein